MDAGNAGVNMVRPCSVAAAAMFSSRCKHRPLQGGYSVVVSDGDDAIPDVFSVEVGSCMGTDDASGCSGEGTTGVSGCGDSTGGGSTGAGFSGGKGL